MSSTKRNGRPPKYESLTRRPPETRAFDYKDGKPLVRPYQRVCANSPSSQESYTDEDVEVLRACNRYRQASGKSTLAVTEILDILKSLGYRKVEDPGPLPSSRADRKTPHGSMGGLPR
jgi:hypothetical protein